MAEEAVALWPCEPPLPDMQADPNSSINIHDPVSETQLRKHIEDDTFQILRRHFLMKGKGRRPDLPLIDTVSNKLLLQLFFLKEESNASYQELSLWLHTLVPTVRKASDGQVYKRIQAIFKSFATPLAQDEATALLCKEFDIDTNPLPDALTDLGLNKINIDEDPDNCNLPPHSDICNDVVVAFMKVMTKENKSPIFVRKWLVKLSLACRELSDMKLRTRINNVMTKFKQLSKNKKDHSKLEDFLRMSFVEKVQVVVSENCCRGCCKNEILIAEKENLIKDYKREIEQLMLINKNITFDKNIKENVIDDLQCNKKILLNDIESLKMSIVDITTLQVKVKSLKKQLNEISDAKLYYKRNSDLKLLNVELEKQIHEVKNDLSLERETTSELKRKIKGEQDMKNKFRKRAETLSIQNNAAVAALNSEKLDNEVQLKQKEVKCTMYSNDIRQLYMTLIGELNVSPTFVSKVVSLISKKLFQKDIPVSTLPCPRTCANFMYEGNHIAKQQIVTDIKNSEHFTYATDGTGREKKHYLEHHIILDNGSTLSVGYTEVADDKASTLLEKSLELFDEMTDVYCQAEDAIDRMAIYTEILNKMKALMSDRAANMKLFNKKMLDHKKDIVGEDASVHFLYCNAHFLIGLAEETEKAVRTQENIEEETSGMRLGRGNDPAFKTWNSSETSASRLLRTAADVFGPRGDEKNGCREEWLAHCDSSGVKSTFTSYRSNRFNCMFENAVALLHHHTESLHFLQDCASHNNLKLQSICSDLQDKRVMSIMTAIAFLSTFLTTPYWSLMNSQTPYGKFPNHVKSMKAALERWSSDEFNLPDIMKEEPVFGEEFSITSDVAIMFFRTNNHCDQVLTSGMFKTIVRHFQAVMTRQLTDFLPGGIYGDDLPDDLQNFLDTCPLTNLTGERMFGDLDYDMTRRRTASTYLRSTVSMWKHNKPSKFLDDKSPNQRKKSMTSARKNVNLLKEKHKESVKTVREKIKAKILENERNKKEKEIRDKEKQAQMLSDILSQGGLCDTKEQLDELLRKPSALQNLKCQIRFRKYYMHAKDLRLTGNMQTLLTSLCNHLGITYDLPEPHRKKRQYSNLSTSSETSDSD